MKKKEQIEVAIALAKEITLILNELIGEMDAIEDYAEYQRGKFTMLKGGKLSPKKNKTQKDL